MKEKQRIDWLDVAKGIGIILVIIGHMNIPFNLWRYIFSFHMPLFFLLSGYVFGQKEYDNFWLFFKKKFLTILLPYFIFGILAVITIKFFVRPITWADGFLNIIKGYGLQSPLWFLTCLFITEICFFFLRNFKKWQLIIVLIASSIIGYILSRWQVHLAWKIDVVFTALVFYGLGFLAKNINFKDFFNNLALWQKIFLPIILIAISLIFAFANPAGPIGQVDMQSNVLGNIFYFYLAALAGIGLIIILSINWKSKILLFFGQNSLLILILHWQIPSWIRKTIANFIPAQMPSYIVRYICSTLILLIFIFVINKYLPFLIGRKNQVDSKP